MRTRIASLAVATAARINERWRFADNSGASLVEYALILGLVSIVAYGALVFLGNTAGISLNASASSIAS